MHFVRDLAKFLKIRPDLQAGRHLCFLALCGSEPERERQRERERDRQTDRQTDVQGVCLCVCGRERENK